MTPIDHSPTTESTEPPEPPPSSSSAILKPIKQLIILILGMSVLLVGIAMIVLPGPATVVIPVGLAILATEFVWARRWLDYLKRRAQDVADWTVNVTTTPESPTGESSSRSTSPTGGS